jgi:5-(carboxyamino)imidazole ribonucleotide synthase
MVENHHREGILRLALAPAPNLTSELQRTSEEYTHKVLEALDYAGVLCIEFFEVDGRLLANEMAPRVHNSGHWTIEGAVTSQFENHLRAILGMPLGATEAVGHSAMINLIGEAPDSAAVLAVTDAHLHLYGKEARPGRKIGHVTVSFSGGRSFVWRRSRRGSGRALIDQVEEQQSWRTASPKNHANV